MVPKIPGESDTHKEKPRLCKSQSRYKFLVIFIQHVSLYSPLMQGFFASDSRFRGNDSAFTRTSFTRANFAGREVPKWLSVSTGQAGNNLPFRFPLLPCYVEASKKAFLFLSPLCLVTCISSLPKHPLVMWLTHEMTPLVLEMAFPTRKRHF